MKFVDVFMDAVGYELGPVVVTSGELEERLAPMYDALRIPQGQLEALTGIRERRWWQPGTSLSKKAIDAALKVMEPRGVRPEDIGALVYTGVCRENFEPATACAVAAGLGIRGNAAIYDITNACLGVLNGVLDVANRIMLGQIRAGLVVSCESSREINDIMIQRMLENKTMDMFSKSLATLTGGSGAVAVLLTDGSFASSKNRKLVAGVNVAAPEHHMLCRWGTTPAGLGNHREFMTTDAVNVMKFGVELGKETWGAFLQELAVPGSRISKVICHQVGAAHQKLILQTLGIPMEKDFSTYEYLGNMGTCSLPITAAIAKERDFMEPGDLVGFLGIGSGLNCMMIAIQW